MVIISQSQEQRAWKREEYGDLQDLEMVGPHCWYCAESIAEAEGSHAEAVVSIDGMTMLVPVCDNCDPTIPPTLTPTPMAARLACPICNETLAPPRRHSCGGATYAALTTTQTPTFELVSNGRRQ